MVVKVIGMMAGIGVSIFLGRTIGAEGLGIINLANQIAGLLLVVTMFGFDNVLVKYVAIAYENKQWPKIADNMFTASVFNGLLAFGLSVIGLLATPWLVEVVFNAPKLKIPLMIALGMIVPQTYSRIFGAGLSGFRKIWQSALVNQTLSTWVVGLLLLVLYVLKIQIDLVKVALIYSIGRLTVCASISFYWKKLFPYRGPRRWNGKPMLKMARPLLLVAATSIIAASADSIMLGWLSNASEVGLYSVAARIALITSFFLQVTNTAISPKLATLFANKQTTAMNIMVHRVTKILILIAFAFLTLFILGGQILLSLWGEEFKQAYWILVVLSIGQFVNISTGCAGLLLIMCGHEKTQGYISVAFVCLNLLLNYFLILQYGAVGAAIATAITVGSENITKVIFAKRKTGVLTIPSILNK